MFTPGRAVIEIDGTIGQGQVEQRETGQVASRFVAGLGKAGNQIVDVVFAAAQVRQADLRPFDPQCFDDRGEPL